MAQCLARLTVVASVILVLIALDILLVPYFAPDISTSESAPLAQVQTPHSIEGRNDCLSCHGAGGAKPVPPGHLGRDNSTCLVCHPAASPPPSQSNSQVPVPSSPSNSSRQQPQGTRIQGNMACLICHERDEMTLTFENGDKVSLHVDPDVYNNSVHGGKLGCTDCHSSIPGYPHPKTNNASLRDYVTAQYEICKRCHFANYTKTLDSVHFQVMSNGDKNAPVCTDCHSAHAVVQPNEPRTKISDACGRCHTQVYDDYAQSVHGSALLDENNQDVPVCTTCHGVHNIQSATSSDFHVNSTELCAKCHSDAKLMNKYGISANVNKTYLDDFHGRTVNFIRQQPRTVWTDKAVCTDCHGVHDIKNTNDPQSPTIKANLVKTCQKCHPDATQNFSSAWLSHYEPSIQKASMVYMVKVYYWILIPVMIGGLILHILLDLWRLARNR